MKIDCKLRKLKINISRRSFLLSWNLAGILPGIWLETGCTGKLAEILARNWLHGENWQDLAEILAEKWLPGGKLAGNWLAGGNSDFPRKSEFRPKPPRTTNFHLKDPGTFQLEFLTLVTMV